MWEDSCSKYTAVSPRLSNSRCSVETGSWWEGAQQAVSFFIAYLRFILYRKKMYFILIFVQNWWTKPNRQLRIWLSICQIPASHWSNCTVFFLLWEKQEQKQIWIFSYNLKPFIEIEWKRARLDKLGFYL